ncbi:hypothetical protein [Microbacterium ulmi]|uniref:Uncharacterized protein n=1 Tax=Microbacterium ulmi TaxID=179095 RepID=A0A7Y2LZ68_9MICO|nr:hypothetical protein [Microbacterium ulmi]NII70797.1 hypothetical protein [Microbacterium ulmi]NNH02814.1 hypothetical protein [Microbacterium ulmi]
MNAPSRRTAPRRTRTGAALITASAAVAAATLVLSAAGGTYALWSDSIEADLGVIQLQPAPTPGTPEQFGTCTRGADGGGWGKVLLGAGTQFGGFSDWYVGETRIEEKRWFDSIHKTGEELSSDHASKAQEVIGLPLGTPTPIWVTVRATPPDETLLVQVPVWFLRSSSTDLQLSCSEDDWRPSLLSGESPLEPLEPPPPPAGQLTPPEEQTSAPVVEGDGSNSPREVVFAFAALESATHEFYDWRLDGHTFTRDGVSSGSPFVRVDDSKLRAAGIVTPDAADTGQSFDVIITPEGDPGTIVAIGTFFARFDSESDRFLVFESAQAESASVPDAPASDEPAPSAGDPSSMRAARGEPALKPEETALAPDVPTAT